VVRALECCATAIVAAIALQSPQPRATLLTVPQGETASYQLFAGSARVSGDGRFIAWASRARLADADRDELADIYVLDRASGAVTLESLEVAGQTIRADCERPRLSADGRYLVFETDVVAADGTSPQHVIVLRDRVMDAARWVARSVTGAAANDWSGHADISADGGTVVFSSAATNLVAGRDVNGFIPDVYHADTATRVIRRISLDARGQPHPEDASIRPSVSADGRYVAFASAAGLDAEVHRPPSPSRRSTQRPLQLYVRDVQLGVTERLRLAGDGVEPDGASRHPAISGDGRYVAFVSDATNLARGDRNRSPDVFLHDRNQRTTRLVSRSASQGGTANGVSTEPAISSDGRFVVFQSEASDMVCERRCPAEKADINLVSDVFRFDRETGSVMRLSADAAAGWMEESGGPAVSASGEVVAFTSRHPVSGQDLANDFDLFIRVPDAREKVFGAAHRR
jgi:Tol biopolymer transport system component